MMQRSRRRRQTAKRKSKLQTFLDSRVWEEYAVEGKPLFTFRSEVWYDGFSDPCVPLPEFAVRINANDVVQVAKILDDDWWIGRVVGHGHACRYIPSPQKWWQLWSASDADASPKSTAARLKVLRRQQQQQQQQEDDTDALADGASSSQQPSLASVFNKNRATVPDEFIAHARNGAKLEDCYVIVPDIRPLVFFGPSKSGFATSDLMQRALMTYLVKSFPGRVVFMDCTLRRQAQVVVATTAEGTRIADPATADSEPFQAEDVERIYRLAKEGKMALVQCDSDRPDELLRSSTLPLLVLVRMNNPAVILPKLAKETIDAGRKLGSQIAAAERLNAMDDSTWDLVLRRCRFDVSCYELAAYVDAYIGESTLELTIDPRMLHPV
ncbi:hypothetical protein PTSG_08754 [Salpingoeca rosetta]|uniref:SH3 domain-containing protein n=1 Tax=Salpingoeca rosetta (strain ATCC 50818 / BSB-021) TaxID=946362 RepID=F2UKL3_SALR5|nr:uncharacterized protein PTSG_08754 [Salpingoeca rosetta]EGD77662.1 hypothetical protein PTSG_08754 [Salpingoeca rosetta]UIX25863.1 voltage-gated calcium channel beta subunit [Salpingoeca rosetta]|eukprot:XP_004990138.1 hypothetical protein PTSG_08754 [Salpingoeca rosetta]